MLKNALYFGFWGLLCFAAVADDAVTDSEPRRVIVTAPTAPLMVGTDVIRTVGPGTLLAVTRRKDDWLFVPESSAWIKSDSVVSLDASEDYFTDIINSQPSPAAFHHRGIARHALGHPEQALRDFDQALQRGLDSAALRINRSNAWLATENLENALSEIEEAIERDPGSALAYNNRALILAAQGEFKRALADASRAIRIDSEFADAYNNRGVTRARLGDYAAAIEDYDRAIQLNDRHVEAHDNRGYAAKQLGRYREALSSYRQAVEIGPASAAAFNDAAWLVATCPEETVRDSERAVEYAEYACKLTEYKNGEYIDTLAAAYASAGRFEDAVRAQQQALTLLSAPARDAAKKRLRLYTEGKAYIETP